VEQGATERVERVTTLTRAVVGEGIDPVYAVASEAVGAGATALVAGTAAFRGGPGAYADNIKALRGAG